MKYSVFAVWYFDDLLGVFSSQRLAEVYSAGEPDSNVSRIEINELGSMIGTQYTTHITLWGARPTDQPIKQVVMHPGQTGYAVEATHYTIGVSYESQKDAYRLAWDKYEEVWLERERAEAREAEISKRNHEALKAECLRLGREQDAKRGIPT